MKVRRMTLKRQLQIGISRMAFNRHLHVEVGKR